MLILILFGSSKDEAILGTNYGIKYPFTKQAIHFDFWVIYAESNCTVL